MPHFYFHILDGHSPADDLGVELADVDAAKKEALRSAASVLREDKPHDIWHGKVWQMQVTDSPSLEDGRVFLTLNLSATCPINES